MPTFGQHFEQSQMENMIIENDEYWWAGIVDKGVEMPLGKDVDIVLDFGDPNTSNQVVPGLISSHGRVIWSETPFKIQFHSGEIRIIHSDDNRNVKIAKAGSTLRDAGMYLFGQLSSPRYRNVPDQFFLTPQYNTWIELMYEQSEEGILCYAEEIVKHGFPPGVLIIDEGWAPYYGEFSFRSDRFTDPGRMIQHLHKLGFQVMLWVTPYISPDSPVFRDLEPKGILLQDRKGETAVRKWWNGYSAILDLSNPDAVSWFCEKLDRLRKTYAIDGFKFDGGDPYMFRDDDRTFGGDLSFGMVRRYSEMGERYAYNEFRSGFMRSGMPLVSRLSDKEHSWGSKGLKALLPDALVCGMFGYSNVCPDMIGGGEINSFRGNHTCFDAELFVRYAEASALCPMMQFSAAPWRILEQDLNTVRDMALLHKRLGREIVKIAATSLTGEPMMRHMEWQFPGRGYARINDQFMIGDRILVAPVLQSGMYERDVVLPEGNWRDDKGKTYKGGHIVCMNAPKERLIWFERVDQIE